MIDKHIAKRSLTYAALALLYVGIVTTVMRNAQRLFGPDGNSQLGTIVFLLLLVVSASTMGLLIFGKPVMLYIDGKKREAVMMAACTIGWLAAFTFLLIVIMAASRA